MSAQRDLQTASALTSFAATVTILSLLLSAVALLFTTVQALHR